MTCPDAPETVPVCSICRRNDGPVCDRCHRRLAEQLGCLPALYDRLRLALVPGSAGAGERVTSAQGEAPMPARLAALALEAVGSDDARCTFVPAVRVWTTVDIVPADEDDQDDRRVLTWHRDQVTDERGRPMMILTDDQAGVLPVREWLRAWAAEWHRSLGHSTDDRPPAPKEHDPPDAPRHLSARLLGIGPARMATDRPDDPVAEEWADRWPADADGWGPVTGTHFAYLRTWLPTAVESMPHIEDFAASLRTLVGAMRAALGDTDDLEYLGRCPEDGCGAAIWHDPYASVITCPRCHAETGQNQRVWLARRILDVWPIDPRRRYPRGLIEVLRMPKCRTCSTPIVVEWIDATERADREPFWRPGTSTCRNGCEVAG